MCRGADLVSVLKVINSVTKLLDALEEHGVLLPPLDVPPEPVGDAGPSDERSMIVKEMLDTERQYVSFLEVLQVRSFSPVQFLIDERGY